MFPEDTKAPNITATSPSASPRCHPVPGAGLPPAPADFGNAAVLRARVRVSAEVLSSLLVASGCLPQDPLHLPLPLPLLECHSGWCPLVQSAPLLLLVVFARSHRFQESRLVFVSLFLLLLSHTPSSAMPFSFRGPLWTCSQASMASWKVRGVKRHTSCLIAPAPFPILNFITHHDYVIYCIIFIWIYFAYFTF